MDSHQFLFITKALSDLSRVRLLSALEQGELCVCQLIALLKLAPSTVSKHMSILRQAGLVSSRKDSRWVYYSQITEVENQEVYAFIQLTMKSLRKSKILKLDKKNLMKILEMDIEVVYHKL